jgi:hypothetical protein
MCNLFLHHVIIEILSEKIIKMPEFLEILKIVPAISSPSLIVIVIMIFFLYQAKNILAGFFAIKDFYQKRLLQKLEDTYRFNQDQIVDSLFKDQYRRLCEEAQFKAVIGCEYCSKEMAQYILSRKDISRAIRIYHRVKDDIEFKNGQVVPKIKMATWRIKTISYLGIGLYVIYGLISLLPVLFLFFQMFTVSSSNIDFDLFIHTISQGAFIFLISLFLLY